jgi:hypothetical protein
LAPVIPSEQRRPKPTFVIPSAARNLLYLRGRRKADPSLSLGMTRTQRLLACGGRPPSRTHGFRLLASSFRLLASGFWLLLF